VTHDGAVTGGPDPSRGDDAHRRQVLADEGYVVLRGAVGEAAITAALRLLNLTIRLRGLTAEEINVCQQTTFFPHLRWDPEVWGVLPPAAAELIGWQEGDDWAEPQLLLRFPDEVQSWPLEPHVDQLPSWSDAKSYRGIVGIALSSAAANDGAPRVLPRSHRGEKLEPVPVPMAAGDALVMHPDLAHSGSLNLGSTIRYAIYFRLLGGGH
jgi:hypothetical protein